VSRVVENDPYELRIVLPAREAYEVDTAVAAGKRTETTREGPGLRVPFPEMASGEVAWQIRFLLRR
jgi:hypothetical protein